MKIINVLNRYVKKMEGNLVGIGLKDTDLIKNIEKNNKIVMCDLLNSISINSKKSTKKREKKKYVKNLKKHYKYKNINNMIINASEVENILKILIKDTVYINKGFIYYYSKKKSLLELIEKRYNRYTKDTKIVKYEDGYILQINTEKAYNSIIKDGFYYILDTLYNVADIIGNVLIS